MLQVAISMVWKARVIQIRPDIASEKESEAWVSSREFRNLHPKGSSRSWALFWTPQNHTCTTVLQPQAGDHRPAPDLELNWSEQEPVKSTVHSIRSSPGWRPKRNPAAVGKVIFEAVGVSGVVDVTGILVGGALWLERQDPDKCTFCSCGSKAKTWASFLSISTRRKTPDTRTNLAASASSLSFS